MPLPEVTLSTAQVWHMRLAARLCPDLLRELQCSPQPPSRNRGAGGSILLRGREGEKDRKGELPPLYLTSGYGPYQATTNYGFCWNGLCYKIILSSQSSWTLEIDIFIGRMPFQAQTTVLKHQRNSTTAKLLKIPHKANLKQIQQNEFTVTCTLSYRLRSQLTITAYSVLHERLSAMFISSSSQVNGTPILSPVLSMYTEHNSNYTVERYPNNSKSTVQPCISISALSQQTTMMTFATAANQHHYHKVSGCSQGRKPNYQVIKNKILQKKIFLEYWHALHSSKRVDESNCWQSYRHASRRCS